MLQTMQAEKEPSQDTSGEYEDRPDTTNGIDKDGGDGLGVGQENLMNDSSAKRMNHPLQGVGADAENLVGGVNSDSGSIDGNPTGDGEADIVGDHSEKVNAYAYAYGVGKQMFPFCWDEDPTIFSTDPDPTQLK